MAGEISAGMGMSGLGNAAVSIRGRSDLDKKRVKSKKEQKKKQLNYNPREISSQILRSVKSGTAAIVLVRAKVKVGSLKKCLGTGQYNDREVLAAVAHAQRMVGCAKMKLNHLKEEEEEGRSNEKEKTSNRQQKKNEIKRRVSQKERELENKIAQEKMQQIRKEKTNQREYLRKKKMHRNKELSKIQEADMKYLKEKSEGSDSSQADQSGVSLELSMSAMGLQELQLSEHAIELMEQQLEQEIAMQVQAEGGMSASLDYSGTSMGSGQDFSGSVVSEASFDVSI